MLSSSGTGTTFNAINWSTMGNLTNFSGGTGAVILIPSNLLPVEWLYFNATAMGDVNKLNWATAKEENSTIFEIQRSKDAVNFEKIGELAASGNSSELRTYEFSDANPIIGQNYYRLKLIANDGTSDFSEIVVLESKSKDNGFSFYPNPVFDELLYSFSSDKAEDIKIEITDMLGRVLTSKICQSVAGSNNIKLDLSALIPGSYNVKSISVNSGIVHSTVIVKK
jgi:hypothetical protein